METDRKVRIGPLNSASAIMKELKRIYSLARNGELDTQDMSRLANLLKIMNDIRAGNELEARLAKLEAIHANK